MGDGDGVADERVVRGDVVGGGDGQCPDLLEDGRVWAFVREHEDLVVYFL